MQNDSPADALGMSSEGAETPKLQRFAASELVTCDSCHRANAPNRTNCIYCGVDLVTEQSSSSTAFANLKSDAPADCGLILVLTKPEESSDEQLALLSSLTELDAAVIKNSLKAGGPLPFLKPQTIEQANNLCNELAFANSIAEQELTSLNRFKQIHGLELTDDTLSANAKSESYGPVPMADVLLVMIGRIVRNRVEIEERRQRRGATPIDSRQFMADEAVMDIYFRGSASGWRIYANAFDYSCLGTAKRMTGFENFAALTNLMRERMPNVTIDESYQRKRAVLETVWPSEQTDSRELRLASRGKVNFANITTSDNEAQFNRYSALAWHLRLKDLENA